MAPWAVRLEALPTGGQRFEVSDAAFAVQSHSRQE